MSDRIDIPAGERPALRRQLGVASMAALLIGITIGSGIFRVPSTVASELGSVDGVALVWLCGAAVTLAGAIPLASLASALPRAGGTYAFLREGYGPLAAFLYGWIKLFVTGPAAVAAVALIFAEYARAFAPLTGGQVQLLAGALVVALTAANIRSVRWSAALQNTSTVAKVIVLAGLAVAIFAFGDPSRGAFAEPMHRSGVTLHGFWTALVVVLWTYTGWVDITYVAGEVREPERTYPRALLIGMTVILAVYLLVNAAYLYVLPIQTMATSALVASTATDRALGGHGASVVAALVMISTFGSLNGTILTSPRVFFAMAQDGLFFQSIGAVHSRGRTPYVALLLYMSLGLVGIATRTFEQLAEIFVMGIWPFYALGVAAVFFVPRRRPELARLRRSFGYPVLPAAFVLVSVVMLANGAVRRPLEMAISVGIVALGVPVFFIWRATQRGRGVLVPAVADAAER